MDSIKKRQEITALIDNIKTHSDRLTNKVNIPILELSVILSKINRLQEKTVVLKFLMANERNIDINEFEKQFNSELNVALSEEPKTEQTSATSKVVKENIQSDKTDVESVSTATEQQDDTTIETQENLNKTANNPSKTEEEKQNQAPINPVKKEIIKDIKKSKEIEVDKTDIPDLNKQFTEEEDPSLGEQLKKQPISDLMTAIGLNERYLFANELFEGEMEKFREAIKILNEFEQRNEAIQYFNETLLPSQQWKADNEMVKALYLLVERRYQ